MKISETFSDDLDRVVRGDAPNATEDPEHDALMATAQRLATTMQPLNAPPPGVRERLETRLVAQLSAAARARWQPSLHLRPLRRWQPIVGLATAAALVLAIVGAAFIWNGSSQSVSAQAILDRAQETAGMDAAPSGITSYHLTATESTVKLPGGTITQETWYTGSDRQRTDTQIKDASGAVVSRNGTISNGTEGWNFITENGQTRVIHTTGTQWSKPSDTDPTQGGSVADLIARYNQHEKACQTATQQGQATVTGRSTYVIVLTPKQGSCAEGKATGAANGTGNQSQAATAKSEKATAAAKGTLDQSKEATVRADKTTAVANGTADQSKEATAKAGQHTNDQNTSKDPKQVGWELGQMTVWVDTQTFLPLKTETKATDSTVLDQYEVTSIEYNAPIPDSIFAYTPPAGAQVSTFNNVPAQDVKATIGARERQGTPVKKP